MRCPVCWSPETLMVLSERSLGRCESCRATWVWSGGQVSRVMRPLEGMPPAPEQSPMTAA
jgi:hypothetical protein